MFRWKRILFLFLNSNFDELSEEENKRQLIFYKNMLKAASKDSAIDFLIVSTHHPPYSNNAEESPSREVERFFVRDFLRLPKGGIFLSGHSHSYEHFFVASKIPTRSKHLIVSGGGGAPRHKLNVDPASRPYADLFKGPAKRFFHFLEVTYKEQDYKRPVLRISVIALDNKKEKLYIADSFKVP